MECPSCSDGKMSYRNANESQCGSCRYVIPNSHLVPVQKEVT